MRQKGTPIQPHTGQPDPAEIHIDPPWREGLSDLEGFDRIWLLVWLDRAKPCRLKVVPYRDNVPRGVFSTRAPSRPNPIGLSCVRLLAVEAEEGVLRVEAVDLLDGTPVLDIKPYVPEFDAFPGAAAGWHSRGLRRDRADDRFAPGGEE